jgi:TPR repeat protein/Zn-dependent protease with chaperone function
MIVYLVVPKSGVSQMTSMRFLALLIALASSLTAQADNAAWDLRGVSRSTSQAMPLVRADRSEYTRLDVMAAKDLVEAADRMSAVAGIRPKLLLQESDTFNAGAAYLGGEPVVFVTPKMFQAIASDRDMAAALFGHEYAHLVLAHGEQSKAAAVAGAVITIIAGTALEILFQRRLGIVNMGINMGMLGGTMTTSAFSREMEREADGQGMAWMVEAGYEPTGAVRLFSMMQRNAGDPLFSFLSTHPLSSDRVEYAQSFTNNWLSQTVGKATQVAQSSGSDRRMGKPSDVAMAASPVAKWSVTLGSQISELNALADQQQLLSAPTSDDALSGAKAFSKGKFESAKVNFEHCASAGEVPCINNLGVLYDRGLGVKADPKLAIKYYKTAAEKGLVLGATNYAGAIAKGYEGPVDGKKIMALYVDAAAKGSPVAMGNVAYFRQVRGSEKSGVTFPSDETIVAYARVAEMRGVPVGAFALGVIYKNGFTVYQDAQLAEKYLLRASAMGDVRADAMLALIYQEQLNKPSEAKRYFETVERSRNKGALLVMVAHFCRPDITEPEAGRVCVHWQKNLAEAGEPNAMYVYGRNLEVGDGVEKDEMEGMAWVFVAKGKGQKQAGDYYDQVITKLTNAQKNDVEARGKKILAALP